MVLTRIPCLPCEVATYIDSVLTPALDTPYAVRVRSPLSDAPDDMLMIEPPPFRTICGMTCLHVSIWLRRLTAMVLSQTSSGSSVTGVSRDRNEDSVSAALLGSTSTRPK